VFFTLAPDLCLPSPHGDGRFLREYYKTGASVLYTRPRFFMLAPPHGGGLFSLQTVEGAGYRTAPPQHSLKNRFSVGKFSLDNATIKKTAIC